jgi:hypothetical protein
VRRLVGAEEEGSQLHDVMLVSSSLLTKITKVIEQADPALTFSYSSLSADDRCPWLNLVAHLAYAL